MSALPIRRREAAATPGAWPSELHPLLARVYAARELCPGETAAARLASLAPPDALGGIERACGALDAAIRAERKICVVGDFDADGATGTALAVRGLRLLGARHVGYRVPSRAREGYGLSVALVESLAASERPDLILTVDNGIASRAGVAAARARGIDVVVTDHHLPGAELPPALAIVNPNCPGDAFPSKALAGVGVMFYLLLALRARLFGAAGPRPDLGALLDLVALGTVADLVPLDANNRILVEAGLRRIRAGRCVPGIAALFRAARRDPARAVASDLGFALGPRINAAGRLEDMGLGIECLLSDAAERADALAAELSRINAERQELQASMVEQAESLVAAVLARADGAALPCGIVLHEAGWHPGVVGLVASRLKERLHRPVVACAPADGHGGELRGSARSIPGFHLRDALAEVDARKPGLILRFGGHAMAAGLSLASQRLAEFVAEFDAVARRRIDPSALERFVWSDGELAPGDFSVEAARALRYGGPWGQGFEEPAFDNAFAVESWRMVGERHLKFRLRPAAGPPVDAIFFGGAEHGPPPPRLRALFHIDVNEWNGREALQLLVRQIEPA